MLPDYYKHELYHYGVLGMKWGVRRYQNKDGSLTAAGKKRNREATKYGKKTEEQLAIAEQAYEYAKNTEAFKRAVSAASKSSYMKREKYISDVLDNPNSQEYKDAYKKSMATFRSMDEKSSGRKRSDVEIEEDWNHHFFEEMTANIEKRYDTEITPRQIFSR